MFITDILTVLFSFFYKNAQIKKRTDDVNGVVHTMEFKGDLYLIAGEIQVRLHIFTHRVLILPKPEM
jgi:hypothetical protein